MAVGSPTDPHGQLTENSRTAHGQLTDNHRLGTESRRQAAALQRVSLCSSSMIIPGGIEETGCGIAESAWLLLRRCWFNDTVLALCRHRDREREREEILIASSVYVNDPAAGSPTATLLRLLLPLASGHRQSSAGHHAPEGTRAVDLQVALASHHR